MINPLGNISREELEKELQRRTYREWQQRQNHRNLIESVALANIDILLELVPDHERTSCSDLNACNAGMFNGRTTPRCVRCFLLWAKNTGLWDKDGELIVQINKVNDPEPPKP